MYFRTLRKIGRNFDKKSQNYQSNIIAIEEETFHHNILVRRKCINVLAVALYINMDMVCISCNDVYMAGIVSLDLDRICLGWENRRWYTYGFLVY